MGARAEHDIFIITQGLSVGSYELFMFNVKRVSLF